MEEQSVQLGPWARLLTATSDPKGVLAALSDKDNVRRMVSPGEIRAIFNAWFSPRFSQSARLAGSTPMPQGVDDEEDLGEHG